SRCSTRPSCPTRTPARYSSCCWVAPRSESARGNFCKRGFMDWDNLIKFAFGSSAITVLLGFVLRAYIKTSFDKSLERFKSKVSQDVERFKSDLVRINNEHSITYSKLHAERAEIIKIIYERLVDLKSSLHSFLKPLQCSSEQSLTTKFGIVVDNYNGAAGYYYKNKIFLDSDVCETVEKLFDEMQIIIIKVRNCPIEYDDPACQSNSKLANEKMNLMHDSWMKLVNEISLIQIDLENKFRMILGVRETPDVS
ncbi:MAG: hypothetical protein ACLGSA_09175, partial [Acidobacteriota bacterium]